MDDLGELGTNGTISFLSGRLMSSNVLARLDLCGESMYKIHH
jgi:hypothetical protein